MFFLKHQIRKIKQIKAKLALKINIMILFKIIIVKLIIKIMIYYKIIGKSIIKIRIMAQYKLIQIVVNFLL